MHRIRRAIIVLAAAFLTIALASVTPAYASGGSWIAAKSGTSACSRAWGTSWASKLGGDAQYNWSWTGYLYSDKLSVYSGGVAKVHDLMDCYSGYGRAAHKIKMHFEFILTGAGLSGCSVGFPSGFSCSASGQQEVLTHNVTCTDAKSCTWDFGPMTFYAPDGGHFSAAYGQLFVDLVSSSGSEYSFSSTRSPS